MAFMDSAHAQTGFAPSAEVTIEFTNPGVSPSHWILTLHPDGSGHFHSERGNPAGANPKAMDVPEVDRDIQLQPGFAASAFETARQNKWFKVQCESHQRVAFEGWKKLSYSGPEGQGSCTFNYSHEKEIQALGDSLLGVEETLTEGARLEMLLEHDRLGLDQEMQAICERAKDGRMQQIFAIREILERLSNDGEVLDRVKKRAKELLAQAGA
jgi:hypothetical protein